MTVSQLDQLPGMTRLGGPDSDREIRRIYCCDLLSLAMAGPQPTAPGSP